MMGIVDRWLVGMPRLRGASSLSSVSPWQKIYVTQSHKLSRLVTEINT